MISKASSIQKDISSSINDIYEQIREINNKSVDLVALAIALEKRAHEVEDVDVYEKKNIAHIEPIERDYIKVFWSDGDFSIYKQTPKDKWFFNLIETIRNMQKPGYNNEVNG